MFFVSVFFFSGESELGIFLDAPENEYTGGVLCKNPSETRPAEFSNNRSTNVEH